jgi:FixJ family two-component response regulator
LDEGQNTYCNASLRRVADADVAEQSARVIHAQAREERIRAVNAAVEAGVPLRQIAREMGITVQRVRQMMGGT